MGLKCVEFPTLYVSRIFSQRGSYRKRLGKLKVEKIVWIKFAVITNESSLGTIPENPRFFRDK
jgi:hypothetical protein